MWPGGVVVRALDLRPKRSRVRISAVPLSGNNFGQVVHTHVPLSSIQYRLVTDGRTNGHAKTHFAPALRRAVKKNLGLIEPTRLLNVGLLASVSYF